MKLVRYGEAGNERPGIWLDGTGGEGARIVDVRGMVFDIQDYDARFWKCGGLARLRGLLGEPRLKTVVADGVRLGPPVACPGQLLCVGKNYREHAAEFGGGLPEEPVWFAKNPRCLIGAGDAIPVPAGEGACVDGEVELALVVARRAWRLAEAEALDVVGGYMVFNDVTDRALQRARGQWFMGKSADGFGPCGPWLVTPDELGDAGDLPLSHRVDGTELQRARTSEMVFSVARLLADITSVMALEPGDVVSTGTPGGIGSARTPPVLYRPGCTVECEIGGIGALRNTVGVRL
jgi:2-keto-4-pentenoate hydratase/2-oxohepta-3-ene-1,7-dioic acid hydratase in catechol pathway